MIKNSPKTQVRFTVENEIGKSVTFGLFSREGGQTLKFVQYLSEKSNEFHLIQTFCEQTENLETVISEVAATIFEISEGETEQDSDDAAEIARAALKPFSTTYGV